MRKRILKIYREAEQRFPGIRLPIAWMRMIKGSEGLTGKAKAGFFLISGGCRRTVKGMVGPFTFNFEGDNPQELRMAARLYEEIELRRICQWVQPGATYVDAGANIGYIAARVAQSLGSRGHMLLFEPDSRVFPRLQKHLNQTGNDTPRCELFQAAVSDETGSAEFLVSRVMGWSSLVPHRQNSIVDTEIIQKVTLDIILQERGIEQVDFLKMDIEGHELAALRGLRETLTSGKVVLLEIEKNRGLLEVSGYSPAHLDALLNSFGYYGVTDKGEWIQRKKLEDEPLENLFYSRDAAQLERLFGKLSRRTDKRDTNCDHQLIAEVWNPTSPEVTARRIIYKARCGQLATAIEDAKELLQAQPDLWALRGHLAYWLTLQQEYREAADHYQTLLTNDPANKEAATRLADAERKMKAAQSKGKWKLQ
jgi:FkbM family methyltransferase